MTSFQNEAHLDPSRGLLSEVCRGEHVESRHYGALALVEGERLWSLGDPDQFIYARSAVKPFQALPLIERGIADRLGLAEPELAVLGASHNGATMHLQAVRSMLARGGLSEEDLRCGCHTPFGKEARRDLCRSGEKPLRVHNNCSGKHAGFLLLSKDMGAPLDRYLQPESPAQREVRKAVLEMTNLDESQITIAVDGCAAPTYRLPLVALARGFERLVNPAGLSAVRAQACERLYRAIKAEPLLLAGEERLCSALLQNSEQMIYPKNGAEGVYACGLRIGDRSFGLAIKVVDGAERGYFPVVIEVLHRLGLWAQVPGALKDYARVPVVNTLGEVVGEVRSVIDFPNRW